MPSFSSVLREVDAAIDTAHRLMREAEAVKQPELARRLRRLEDELEDLKRHLRSVRNDPR